MTIGTNHLGPFLLTNLLLDKLKSSKPSRIVNVSSRAHEKGQIDLNDLNYATKPFNSMEAYRQSKLANVMFSDVLAKKLDKDEVANYFLFSYVCLCFDRSFDRSPFTLCILEWSGLILDVIWRIGWEFSAISFGECSGLSRKIRNRELRQPSTVLSTSRSRGILVDITATARRRTPLPKPRTTRSPRNFGSSLQNWSGLNNNIYCQFNSVFNSSLKRNSQSLATISNDVLLGLPDFDLVKLGCLREAMLDPVPNKNGQVFRRRDDMIFPEPLDIQVDVLVIQLVHDGLVHYLFKVDNVDHHSRPRVDLALDSNFNGIVVSMSV